MKTISDELTGIQHAHTLSTEAECDLNLALPGGPVLSGDSLAFAAAKYIRQLIKERVDLFDKPLDWLEKYEDYLSTDGSLSPTEFGELLQEREALEYMEEWTPEEQKRLEEIDRILNPDEPPTY